MSKMHNFSNKSSKIAKRCWLSAPNPFKIRYWLPEVAKFGHIVVFQKDYNKIEL